MGADLSRVRFDALRDHSGVVMQQGRLLLDADWNEFVAILDRRLRAGAADLGSTGPKPGIAGVAVVPRTTPGAFDINLAAGAISIGRGRMYVDGLLAENHGTGDPERDPLLSEVRLTRDTPYLQQPYWHTPAPLPTAGTHLVYLDVWQREVTHLEAPDLVEKAVGVDTTARTQTVWQVRVHAPATPGIARATPDKDIPGWLDVIAPSAGQLTTGTTPVEDKDDPCELPPTGGYRGLENQAYRVEIHTGGAVGTATFKWSRDNASVAMPVTEVVSATRVRPSSLGKDDVLRFSTGDWVEILDDHREFNHLPGEMRRIEVHEEDGTISWSGPLPTDLQLTKDQAAERRLRIRRWDQRGKVMTTTGTMVVDLDSPGASGVISVQAGRGAVVLEHGVTVQLDAPGGKFRTGDYWVFAARSADNSVEPLRAAPPRGIHHHYARLAVATFPGSQSDCRTLWPPPAVSEICGDCTVCVTPESHASGALTIQDAVDRVSPTGGTVCLAAGLYQLGDNGVHIDGATSVTVRGQGARSLLLARGNAVTAERSAFIRLEGFSVISAGGAAAIRLGTTAEVTATRLTVVVAAPEKTPGFELAGVALLTRIRDSLVAAPVGVTEADHATLLTAGLEITGNVLACPMSGVSFRGLTGHLLGNEVRGNTVLLSTRGGLRSLGLVGPGGLFDISGNEIAVPGTGVEAGEGGFAVRDNEIVGTGQPRETGCDGIAITRSSFGWIRGQVRVTGNHLCDLGGTGVAVRAPVGDLDVSHNLIERALQGIIMEERGRALTATVSGNVVRDMGSRESDKAGGVTGIQLVGVGQATVEANTVDGVATARETAGGEAAGVRVLASLESRVSGNSVDRVGVAEGSGPAVGIQVAGFFARTLVQGNRSRRLPGDVDEITAAPWCGLQIGVRPQPQEVAAVSHLASYASVSGETSYVIGSEAAYALAGSADVSATVDTNTVTGGGLVPTALVAVGGEAVVAANHCRHRLHSESPALELHADAATVSANRVRGGHPSMSLQVQKNRLAVLGNLTSAGIHVPGGLDPAWAALNPDGIL